MAFMPPQGPQGPQQGPSSPPPQTVPQQPLAATFAVDPGAITGCLFRNTYIWPRNGRASGFIRPLLAGHRLPAFAGPGECGCSQDLIWGESSRLPVSKSITAKGQDQPAVWDDHNGLLAS